MRQVVLDTETTGLDPKLGHRIIEVACVELMNRRLTKRHLHRYVNPERDIDAGAQAVHGISREQLEDKPLFRDIADELVEFLRGAELVIHNAAFDVGFLNHEFALLDLPPIASICPSVLDTLKAAREIRPGKRNNLDALCEYFGINNAHRTLHGALLDAELLADVYLAMTRGQETLGIVTTPTAAAVTRNDVARKQRAPLLLLQPDADEDAAHERVLDAIARESKDQCLWRRPAEPAGG